MELNKKEIHILLHSLGWSDMRWHEAKKLEEEPYRNYFYTSINGDDYQYIKELINKGLMNKSEKAWEGRPDSFYFYVTDNGIQFAKNHVTEKLKKEKPSASKRRYEIYLKCDVDETFGEWLKNKFWDSYRKTYGV